MMDYGDWPPPPMPSVHRRARPDRLGAFWRGVRLAWVVILLAAATFAIASGQHEDTMPFPMRWGGLRVTSIVGPPVAGHGHSCHPGHRPARPTRIVGRTASPCVHSSRPSSRPSP